jgi:superoxide reductase
MIKIHQVYKCSVCGNVVEVIEVGGGELVCCGKPMNLMEENIVEASHEKHLPVIEDSDGVIKVKIGSEIHPMDENHYIEWIEIFAEDGEIFKKQLKPGDSPEAVFKVYKKVLSARAYCNLHGLWKS